MEIPKIEISAKKIVDKVLDEIEFKGKSIREWAEYLIRNADDLISRQEAIDYLLDDLYDLEDTDCVDKEFIKEGLKRVPSVQPNPEKDRQESKDYCAECDHVEMCSWYPHDGCEFRETKTKQKTGQWILNKHTDTVLCSQCGKCYGDEYNYCPNCGAKMETEE